MAAWICTVCDYVHQGKKAPQFCPVCEADATLFSEKKSNQDKHGLKPVKWRCIVCGYIHDGNEPPLSCPICGVPKDQFEGVFSDVYTSQGSSNENVVIVGAGIAGLSAMDAIIASGTQSKITLITREKEFPYYRINLTRYLAGEVTAQELILRPESWYTSKGVTVLREVSVRAIDALAKEVVLSGGETLSYTKLILANGAHSFIPPFEGVEKSRVFSLRTLSDADAILQQCRTGRRGVIIGGGILGLEVAGALLKRDVSPIVIESGDSLLPRQLTPAAGNFLERFATRSGIEIVKNERVDTFLGDDFAEAVLLKSGKKIVADFFVITTGVRSNTRMARQAGLTVNNGIVVNDKMKTSIVDIFACGDAAEHRGITYGTWTPAQQQGAVAGKQAVGIAEEFKGVPRSNVLKVLGIDMFSIGEFHVDDGSVYKIVKETSGQYVAFFFRDNRLIGANLVGDISMANMVKEAIGNKMDFSRQLRYMDSLTQIIKPIKGDE